MSMLVGCDHVFEWASLAKFVFFLNSFCFTKTVNGCEWLPYHFIIVMVYMYVVKLPCFFKLFVFQLWVIENLSCGVITDGQCQWHCEYAREFCSASLYYTWTAHSFSAHPPTHSVPIRPLTLGSISMKG